MSWRLRHVNGFYYYYFEIDFMDFSEHIIQIKNERNLLQKDIASSINITVRNYKRYEMESNNRLYL